MVLAATQHRRGSCAPGQLAQPGGRVPGVQRQVGAPRLEDRDERDDQVETSGQMQADHGLPGHAPSYEFVPQLI